MYLEITSKSNNRYLFDALSNEIYSLDDDFQIPINASRESLDLPNIIRNIETDPHTFEKINGTAKTLIIELTEKCNLRCTYCVFDESYTKERSHSNNRIDLSLAKQRIQEFSNRAKQDAYIIFYGGEPLLEFDNIVKLTDYAKEIFGNRVKFSFTTNGMALTPDKFEFLVSNDFLITISLDGFKINHDRYRLTINGNPSWDKIMKNMEKLKTFSEKFYQEKVIINSVIGGIQDISKINNEFNNNELLQNKTTRFSFTIQENINETKKYNASNQLNYEDIERLFLDKSFDQNLFYKDRLLPLVKKIAFRVIGNDAQLGKKKCIPFVNRTYIRSNGDIQFCERISSFNKVVENNNLFEESEKIQQEFYDHKRDTCSTCYAYNFCELCPASFYSDGKFSQNHQSICDNFREEFSLALNLYIDLKEKNISLSTYG